jgi:hypothetical protein
MMLAVIWRRNDPAMEQNLIMRSNELSLSSLEIRACGVSAGGNSADTSHVGSSIRFGTAKEKI